MLIDIQKYYNSFIRYWVLQKAKKISAKDRKQEKNAHDSGQRHYQKY